MALTKFSVLTFQHQTAMISRASSRSPCCLFVFPFKKIVAPLLLATSWWFPLIVIAISGLFFDDFFLHRPMPDAVRSLCTVTCRTRFSEKCHMLEIFFSSKWKCSNEKDIQFYNLPYLQLHRTVYRFHLSFLVFVKIGLICVYENGSACILMYNVIVNINKQK